MRAAPNPHANAPAVFRHASRDPHPEWPREGAPFAANASRISAARGSVTARSRKPRSISASEGGSRSSARCAALAAQPCGFARFLLRPPVRSSSVLVSFRLSDSVSFVQLGREQSPPGDASRASVVSLPSFPLDPASPSSRILVRRQLDARTAGTVASGRINRFQPFFLSAARVFVLPDRCPTTRRS